ncbi:very-long-chain 3-oxoacyl-CoA reductase isoform X3 [Eurytemora carolleeae]|uniref:very-long-chain 3-oxoacyl-CoA reductase isoform X3 n=1 Tax=Eurytemora carolleeae TaxID=1294199 RepID=UPI000C76D529|nr:very-long-chain 3-oxoacyl-CoA reductase isoform X3 [Eurytemora carolleeae]|eukprot:XP_023322169.1 very-long-chain 3-oxoacyl-CoA reductase-like isoform X3 [Eurytemora affinis]
MDSLSELTLAIQSAISLVLNCQKLMILFTVIGVLSCIYSANHMFKYLSKFVRCAVDVTTLGDWAVVTGATHGIGKGFVEELASRGMNIVLVSRNQSKLEDLAEKLERRFNIRTIIIPVDFTQADTVLEKIQYGIMDIKGDIGLLINNVGMGYEHPEYFLDIENCAQVSRDMVSVNVSSVINVTLAVLPGMVERKRGAVINIGFLSTLQTSPIFSVYSACKAFVRQFSQDLEIKYRSKGIIVQALAPGFVVSNMSKVEEPSFFVATPQQYVRNDEGISNKGSDSNELMRKQGEGEKTAERNADELMRKQEKMKKYCKVSWIKNGKQDILDIQKEVKSKGNRKVKKVVESKEE